ncbi:hypothetical protein [Leifsonia poae]|uniref:hypothetical protein n=1 Tax=Leifsonia poae TaxID=110933 RepID=UPI003D669AF5
MGHDYGSDQLDATDRKAGSRTRLRSFLAIPTVLALTVAAFLSAGVAAALPGSPGVPQAPATLVYHEDFQNQPATNGVRIGQYVGGPAALGETYLTSPNWAPAGDQCNGWVLRSNTPATRP